MQARLRIPVPCCTISAALFTCVVSAAAVRPEAALLAFTDIGAGLPGVSTCSLVWGDYDNDGDLDILLAGNTGLSRITKIYRNHNDGFTDIGAILVGVDNCSVAWGDFDNDGDLDLLLAGDSTGGRIARIYSNSGPPPNTTHGAPASLRVSLGPGERSHSLV